MKVGSGENAETGASASDVLIVSVPLLLEQPYVSVPGQTQY